MSNSIQASDVGLWLALPAFAPAVLIAAVFIFVVRRDRRADADTATEGGDDAAAGLR